ncbi:MAG TPA: hypothetical protein VNT01_06195 [Symbiobacteriaceae bacterium]|nr:hypothetical protein [Symbiobacteriaceae bacterium]
MTDWTQFRELASSTGYIFLVIILIWCLVAGIMYWAFVTGTTSMHEEVKFKIVEDDKPVAQ